MAQGRGHHFLVQPIRQRATLPLDHRRIIRWPSASGVEGFAEDVAVADGGAEVGEDGEEAELEAVDEEPVGREGEAELVGVLEGEAVVDLGDVGVGEAESSVASMGW
jgi:hypothetical protein